ncbi:MAG TPA: phospholipase D family protein [Patescibacteria group bacterium]|nr:phospholipase D family protein [Patescibacteria group bacterium]
MPLASTLADAVRPLTEAHPGVSGLVALDEGGDAFAARIQLADAAEHAIDAQYYIWHHDNAGTLLLQALLRAADRGVKVRLLLDDNNTAGLDDTLAALNTHRCIEVRVFNPFRWRRFRALGLIADFTRLNRRMHNKSFTVDGVATIVGGRNIGDEYFGTGEGVQFIDLDVFAIGPVVDEVRHDFERYWHSVPAQPLARVLGTGRTDAAALALLADERRPSPIADAPLRARCVNDLLCGCVDFEWAPTRLISDDPAKVLGRAHRRGLAWPKLREILGSPKRELHLVSPYFVPTAAGVAFFTALARQGVRISVLTNSLEATDVVAVHAGYAKWRVPLLRAGIALFETRRLIALPRTRRRKLLVRSAASLHTKTFAIDRERVFIGSFNFDPRSARLNTEMGFMIDSPALARACAEGFGEDISAHAYAVRLDPDPHLCWHEHDDGAERAHRLEPGASIWRRALVRLLSWLPIEHLL